MPEPDRVPLETSLVERLDAWTARRAKLASRRLVTRAGMVPAVVIPATAAAMITYLASGQMIGDRDRLLATDAVFAVCAAAGYLWYRTRGRSRVERQRGALERSRVELRELTDPNVAAHIPQAVWIRAAIDLGAHVNAYADAAELARRIVGRGAQAITTEMFNVTGLDRLPADARDRAYHLAVRLSAPRTAAVFDQVHAAWRRHPDRAPASNAFAKPVPNPDSVFTVAWTAVEIDDLLADAPGAHAVFTTLVADAGGQAWDDELVEFARVARDVCLPA